MVMDGTAGATSSTRMKGPAPMPSCVVASMRTLLEMGSGEPRTVMVWGPLPMAKWIVSVPARAFASLRAARRVQTPAKVAQMPSP